LQCKIRCRIQNRSRFESLVSAISRYPKVHTPPEYGRITLSISQEPASDIQPCCACAVRVPSKGAQVGYGSQLLIHVGRLHSEGSSEIQLRAGTQIHRQNPNAPRRSCTQNGHLGHFTVDLAQTCTLEKRAGWPTFMDRSWLIL